MYRRNADKDDELARILKEREDKMKKSLIPNNMIQPNKSGQIINLPSASSNSELTDAVDAIDNPNGKPDPAEIVVDIETDEEEQPRDKTALYIVGGVVAVAALFILYNSVKKDKKSILAEV